MVAHPLGCGCLEYYLKSVLENALSEMCVLYEILNDCVPVTAESDSSWVVGAERIVGCTLFVRSVKLDCLARDLVS